MKQLKILLIGVIGMMSFTATATTSAKLEEKQKTVLNYDDHFMIEAASVVNDFEFVADNSVQIFQSYALPIKTNNDLKIDLAIISDVGWQRASIKFTTIHYKEKLLENYNLNFSDKRKQDLSIRSDC